LVAITLQGSFYVYDVANAIQRHKPTWPASKLQLLVVTPDGKRAVVGPGKGRLRITDVQTGGSSGEIGNPNETFLDLAAASDNRRVLAGSADNVARLWDLTTGQELKVYKGHENNVLAVAITPSCRWVATGAGALDSKGPVDHSVRVWEMNSGNQTRVFDDATRPITKLAFSSDDKLLAAGDLSGMVRVYHIFDAKRVWQAEIGGTPVTALHFLPDGRLLCACGADREVQVRDGSGAKVGGWVAQHAACVAVSANGKLVATGSDQVIQLWRFPGAKD
jgi:WD40 repeat protein